MDFDTCSWLCDYSLRKHSVHTDVHALACSHEHTWPCCRQEGGIFFFFLPLTGSIKGQSAAEPHAARQQRDTADYRVTARHTMDGGCVFGERELQWEGDRRWEKRWAGRGGECGLYLDFPFGTKLLPLLSKWDVNSFVCEEDKLFAHWQVQCGSKSVSNCSGNTDRSWCFIIVNHTCLNFLSSRCLLSNARLRFPIWKPCYELMIAAE